MTDASQFEAAKIYDQWYDGGWGHYAFSIELDAIKRACGPLAGLRILDMGCGTGRFTDALARIGAKPTGLDRDPDMLAVAAARLPDGLFVQGSAERLPFATGTFDVGLAVCVCEFTSDPAHTVTELARVVRPGGRIVIGVLNPTSPWGLAHRHRFKRSPWTTARFLPRRRLRQLGARHGTASITSALYAPTLTLGIDYCGPVLESMGRALFPGFAAFQVLAITKSWSRP